MHRERVERHCKGVTTSLNEFKARFQQMVEEHDKEVSQEQCLFEFQSMNMLVVEVSQKISERVS